jgi:hypothetical protein
MARRACPHCGAALRPGARACPACGSDDRTGWRPAEDLDHEAVELPEEVDYDDFLEREGLAPARPGGRRLWIAAVALLVALVLLLALSRG